MPGSMIDCSNPNTAARFRVTAKRLDSNEASQPQQVQENTQTDPRIIAEIQRQASLRNNFSQSEGH